MVLETEVYSNPAPNPLPLPRQCRAIDHLADPPPGPARRILRQRIEPEELRFGDLKVALERLLAELPQHETGDMIAREVLVVQVDAMQRGLLLCRDIGFLRD